MNTKHSTKIITKLNRDTKEGKINWYFSRNKPSSVSGSEVLSDNVYTCKVLDKNIRLYKYQAKYYYDEGLYEWTERYRLEFVDEWGNVEWTFPADEGIYHLYETVQFKTSNVEGFIDKFLSDDEKMDLDVNPDELF